MGAGAIRQNDKRHRDPPLFSLSLARTTLLFIPHSTAQKFYSVLFFPAAKPNPPIVYASPSGDCIHK